LVVTARYGWNSVCQSVTVSGTEISPIGMAIYHLLKHSTLEPEELGLITEAYEPALHTPASRTATTL
jgi:hypothetical protein